MEQGKTFVLQRSIASSEVGCAKYSTFPKSLQSLFHQKINKLPSEILLDIFWGVEYSNGAAAGWMDSRLLTHRYGCAMRCFAYLQNALLWVNETTISLFRDEPCIQPYLSYRHFALAQSTYP